MSVSERGDQDGWEVEDVNFDLYFKVTVLRATAFALSCGWFKQATGPGFPCLSWSVRWGRKHSCISFPKISATEYGYIRYLRKRGVGGVAPGKDFNYWKESPKDWEIKKKKKKGLWALENENLCPRHTSGRMVVHFLSSPHMKASANLKTSFLLGQGSCWQQQSG